MRWRVKGAHTGPLGIRSTSGTPIEIEGFANSRIATVRIQQDGNNGTTGAH